MDTWIAIAISSLALVVSALSLFLSRRTLMTEVITKQRMEWIHNVRGAVTEFVSACLQSTDKAEITVKKMRVELFLNYNNQDHLPLIEAMNDCCSCGEVTITYVEKVVESTQKLLNKSWRRMKIESGMSRNFEKKRDANI
jgi:hypothetical protein